MKFDAYRITGVSGAATECDSSCSFQGNSSKIFLKIFSETSKTGNGLEERHCIQLPANYFSFFFGELFGLLRNGDVIKWTLVS